MSALNKWRAVAGSESSQQPGSVSDRYGKVVQIGGTVGSDSGSVLDEGRSDVNSDSSKPSGFGGSSGKSATRKLSQWSLVKKKLNIRSGAAVSGNGGATKGHATLGHPILIRTASKKSIATNASLSNGTNGETVRIENTYQLGPEQANTFRPLRVRDEIRAVTERILANERYDSTRSGIVTVRLAEAVKDKVKTLGFLRYKVVVQTTLSSANGQSFEIASRCLWNADTDNYATVVYQNPSLFAVVSVYGLYYE